MTTATLKKDTAPNRYSAPAKALGLDPEAMPQTLSLACQEGQPEQTFLFDYHAQIMGYCDYYLYYARQSQTWLKLFA